MKKELLIVGIIIVDILVVVWAYDKRKNKVNIENKPTNNSITQIDPIVPPKPTYTLQNAIDSIKADGLKSMVEYLSSDELEGRKTGSPGMEKARDFLLKELTDCKLPAKTDVFKLISAKGENVYAWMEGSEKGDEIVVVGAHYDHLGKKAGKINPGADDNASGTAAVLAMAKALSKLQGQNKRTIVFQFYAGEEQGLLGSEFYVENPKFPLKNPSIKQHIFMENLDMIGHGNFEQASSIDSPISGLINSFKDKYPFAAKITTDGSNGSDHASFRRAGVPVIMIHTGLHGKYHTPADKPDTLNYKNMEKITQFGLELLWEVCQNGTNIKVSDIQVRSEAFLDHGVTPFEKVIDHATERKDDELQRKN
jgi:hypothetical protein